MLNEQIRQEPKFSPEKPKTPEYSIMESDFGREELLLRTDEFIDQVREAKPDILVFLDKSARPTSWLFRERFKYRFPKEDSPDIKFINIGSEKHDLENERLKREIEVDEKEGLINKLKQHDVITASDVPESWKDMGRYKNQIEKLREIFGKQFDGKSAMVVDEVSLTGHSMATAMEFLNRAFPKIKTTTATSFFLEGYVFKEEVTPWFHKPALIGVLDTLSEQQLLASNLDKKNLESAKLHLDEQKDGTIHNFQYFVETKTDDLQDTVEFLNKVIKEYKVDFQDADSIGFNKDFIVKTIETLRNKELSRKEIETLLYKVYCSIADAKEGVEKCLKIVRDRKKQFRLYRAVPLFDEFLEKYIDMDRAIKKRYLFKEEVEEGFGQAKILRAELKKLAKTEVDWNEDDSEN